MSTVTAVVGLQFGDEGKGKIVDVLAKDYDFIIRYQGGDNAGHTVTLDDGREIIFHLIPSGILHENKTGVIGHGVVFNPASFIEELNNLKRLGFNPNIYISKNAHLIMPYHIYLDEVNNYNLGTTKKGIGPAYVDKVARMGIKIEDIFDEEKFKKKLEFNLKEKEHILKNRFSKEEILKEYIDYGKILFPYVKDTVKLLHQALKDNKSMLFEGAQGTLLDINYGIYPYVTSSDCSIGGVCTGTGISPRSIKTVIGVMKSYTTRVGEGPLITEEKGISEELRELGEEYGATTGRPRRCGWLDLVAIKYAVKINDIDYLAVTKLDVLSKFENIKVCIDYKTNYKYKDIICDSLLPVYDGLVEPQYLNLEGWMCDISDIKKYEDLPRQLKEYIELIEYHTQRPVRILSIGSRRSHTIWRNQ